MPSHHAHQLRRGLFTGVAALALSLVASAPALAASHSTADTHKTQGTSGTSGDPQQPQPTSNADQNSGGANGQCPGGPYCSTRDGSPSGNGNQATGGHTGEPCAGCVGKADNKNPQGQKPNGTDHNAGYECDRNHGIGRSNPAHTGCTVPTTTGGGDCTTNPTAPGCTPGGGSDCTTNPTAPGCTPGGGSDCTTNPTAEGCTSGGGGTTCVPTAANNFCSSVLGEHQSTPPPTHVNSPTVLSESVTQPPAATGTLPVTGAPVMPLVSAGIGALAAGGLLLLVAARRRCS